MLNSALGTLLYRILPNDYSWGLLSPQEQSIVNSANADQYLDRPEYRNPELKEAYRSFDQDDQRQSDLVGGWLHEWLDNEEPHTVLEIGPGWGFYTHSICFHPAVKRYIAIDNNPYFLDWLRPRLVKVSETKPGFTFDLVVGDAGTVHIPTCDAIVMLSAIHHIPDRAVLFRQLASKLCVGGTIFAIDPSHYLPRIIVLLKKFIRDHRRPGFWRNYRNLNTHHFCTIGEFLRILNEVNELSIDLVRYHNFCFPRGIGRAISLWLNKNYPPPVDGQWVVDRRDSMCRWFCWQMNIVFRRQ